MEKPLKMLRYICISLFLLWSASVAYGQVADAEIATSKGFTVGVNLAGPINKLFDDGRSGISFLSRMSLKSPYSLLAEVGYENVLFENSKYSYSSNGTFFKAGVEYDVFAGKAMGSNDNLLFGLHYGYAIQEQEASSFTIENSYWGDYHGDLGVYTVNTHWLELSGGPRMELFKNFYMGWTLQLKLAVYRDNPDILSPYLIPGFGNGDNRINLGFSYSVEYLIPWNKSDKR
jgi:hypothetical protein